MSELRFDQVTVRFGHGTTASTAVDAVDLTVRSGTTHPQATQSTPTVDG